MPLANALRAGFVEALLEELEDECEPAIEVDPDEADAIYMSGCDIFLVREEQGRFTLTVDNMGKKSAITLEASLDRNGTPRLSARLA